MPMATLVLLLVHVVRSRRSLTRVFNVSPSASAESNWLGHVGSSLKLRSTFSVRLYGNLASAF